MDIKVDDDGWFYYQCDGEKEKLGAQLTCDEVNGKILSRIELEDGSYLSGSGNDAEIFPGIGGNVVSKRLNKWFFDKFKYRDYKIPVHELLYLQMLASESIYSSLGDSLGFSEVISKLRYLEIRPYSYKRILKKIEMNSGNLSEISVKI